MNFDLEPGAIWNVARLTYASSAWWDFTTADDRRRIEGFLRRGIRAGFYLPSWPTVENLVEDADDVLFSRVLNNENHVLYPLLPTETIMVMNCDVGATIALSLLNSNDDKRNFVYRQIHKDSYYTPSSSHHLIISSYFHLHVRLRFVSPQ